MTRGLVLALLAATPAHAAEVPAEGAQADSSGWSPPLSATSPLRIAGYVDVGFAKVQGNGSSFRPGDTRLPADYGADAFAPAVNSRGEVASLDAGGRFTNGFLPRSVEIGNRASFLLNTLSGDVQYAPASAPILVFARVQFLPRFGDAGNQTRVLVEQAFGRLTPLTGQELTLFVGKFDSVFGIEYLQNEANLRTGVTPSLIARYTTGQSLGVKGFYQVQLPALASALTVNAAATNHGTEVESLETSELSLSGAPVGSARFGYELSLLRAQFKAGVSGLYGPRNDQSDSHVVQRAVGVDGRLTAGWLSLAGEYLARREEPGTAEDKRTGTGPQTLPSGFRVHGFYVEGALGVPVLTRVLQVATVYIRYDRRHAEFDGSGAITTSRVTLGGRLDLYGLLALKTEVLFNRENAVAPTVPNDVVTASAVFSF